MKRIALILATLALTGCASLDLEGQLENRVACTVAKDKAFTVSEYGPIGITGKIADKDAAVICKP